MSLFKKVFFSSLIVACVVLAAIIYVERASIYSYDVTNNYIYNFHSSNSLPVKLEGGKLIVPEIIDSRYDAFLKINVETTLLGKIFEPSLELKSEKKSLVQCIELGAKGTRFINISSLLMDNVREIVVSGNRAKVEDQNAEFIFFDKPDISSSKILVIAPHPDDAEIAAYGLYSKYPNNSFILTITSGDEGWFMYDELYTDTIQHYIKKGQIRTWNSITVPLLAGVPYNNILNLGFFDGTLKEMYQKNPINVNAIYTKTSDINTYRKQNISNFKNDLKGSANWNSLVDELKMILNKINPDIIITPHPAMDSHSDHQFTSIALFQAIKESDFENGLLFLYTNHFTMNEYYPYGKAGSIVSLPPNFNDSIYFKSIYSNSLNNDLQIDKVFALDAMNDLRPDTEWRFWKGSAEKTIKNIGKEVLNREWNYFRRAIRSEELFFVMPVEDIYDDVILDKLTDGIF